MLGNFVKIGKNIRKISVQRYQKIFRSLIGVCLHTSSRREGCVRHIGNARELPLATCIDQILVTTIKTIWGYWYLKINVIKYC